MTVDRRAMHTANLCRDAAVHARRLARFYLTEARELDSDLLRQAAAIAYERAEKWEAEAKQWVGAS